MRHEFNGDSPACVRCGEKSGECPAVDLTPGENVAWDEWLKGQGVREETMTRFLKLLESGRDAEPVGDSLLNRLFPDFDFKGFPLEVCTSRSLDKRELNILEAPSDFWCLVVLVHAEYPDQFRVLQARPYMDMWEPIPLFGWVLNSGDVVDHHLRSIHGDKERVVAWKRIDHRHPKVIDTPWTDDCD